MKCKLGRKKSFLVLTLPISYNLLHPPPRNTNYQVRSNLVTNSLFSRDRTELFREFHRTAHCTKCELTSNLWLCLICGALGCGRQQFGGGGGNGHGLEHTKETGHSVAVKLGTIEPDGSAGMPFLSRNLAHLSETDVFV